MLPAGVDTKTPSATSFLISNFAPYLIESEAACLLCLKMETSLIARYFFFDSFYFLQSSLRVK